MMKRFQCYALVIEGFQVRCEKTRFVLEIENFIIRVTVNLWSRLVGEGVGSIRNKVSSSENFTMEYLISDSFNFCRNFYNVHTVTRQW